MVEKWQWHCKNCGRNWVSVIGMPMCLCDHPAVIGNELVAGDWDDCPWTPKYIRDKETRQKIINLKAIADNLISVHWSKVHQLTPQQREQLRDRGYNV